MERLHVISNIPVTKKSINDEVILSNPPPPSQTFLNFKTPNTIPFVLDNQYEFLFMPLVT